MNSLLSAARAALDAGQEKSVADTLRDAIRSYESRNTHTIQLWPSGKSITYRWEDHESTDVDDLLVIQGDKARLATKDEHRDIRIAEMAKQFGEREVRGCQTSLVENLRRNDDGIGELEIDNLTPDPSEWDIDQCNQWLSDEGATGDADFDKTDVSAWRDAVRDNATEREVLEWWIVTEWLAEKLKLDDEVVAHDGQTYWWGRLASGQAFLMDGVLQSVAARLFDSR